MRTISLEGNKYVLGYESGIGHANRYGEAWREIVGDKLIGAMYNRIVELEDALEDTMQRIQGLDIQ